MRKWIKETISIEAISEKVFLLKSLIALHFASQLQRLNEFLSLSLSLSVVVVVFSKFFFELSYKNWPKVSISDKN